MLRFLTFIILPLNCFACDSCFDKILDLYIDAAYLKNQWLEEQEYQDYVYYSGKADAYKECMEIIQETHSLYLHHFP